MRANLARFYGFSDKDIDEMSWDSINTYFRCIERIRAEEILWAIRVSSFPNLKPHAREKLIGDLRSTITPAIRITPDDLGRILKHGRQ